VAMAVAVVVAMAVAVVVAVVVAMAVAIVVTVANVVAVAIVVAVASALATVGRTFSVRFHRLRQQCDMPPSYTSCHLCIHPHPTERIAVSTPRRSVTLLVVYAV